MPFAVIFLLSVAISTLLLAAALFVQALLLTIAMWGIGFLVALVLEALS